MFQPITIASKTSHLLPRHHSLPRRLASAASVSKTLSKTEAGRQLFNAHKIINHDVIRKFSTSMVVGRGYHPHRDRPCCCGCQKRDYASITASAHNCCTKARNHDAQALQHKYHASWNPSSQFSKHTFRNKSDATNPGGSVSGTAVQGETQSRISTNDNDNDNNDVIIPGAQKGGRKLAIVFTCTVCDTRSVKQFTEKAYNHGVVIVQCPGCQNRHLIADNLGFFEDGEGWNIEKALSEMGEGVQVVNDDNVMELSVEDLYGVEKIKEAKEAAATTIATGVSNEKS